MISAPGIEGREQSAGLCCRKLQFHHHDRHRGVDRCAQRLDRPAPKNTGLSGCRTSKCGRGPRRPAAPARRNSYSQNGTTQHPIDLHALERHRHRGLFRALASRVRELCTASPRAVRRVVATYSAPAAWGVRMVAAGHSAAASRSEHSPACTPQHHTSICTHAAASAPPLRLPAFTCIASTEHSA